MEYERSDVAVDRLELLRTYGYGLCMGAADASRAFLAGPSRSCWASTAG